MLHQPTIKEFLYKNFGLVVVNKAMPPSDPLDPIGFLEWEGAFVSDLIDATTVAHSTAQNSLKDSLRRDGASKAIVLLAILLSRMASDFSSAIHGQTIKRMLMMAQASADSYAAAGIGNLQNISAIDQGRLERIGKKLIAFMFAYYGTTFANKLTGIIQNSENNSDAQDAIDVAFTKALNYWSIFAISALNTSRSFGIIYQFYFSNVKYVSYWNPLDERTTSFCRSIAGITVPVTEVRKQVLKLADANSIKDYANISPFVNESNDGFSVTIDGESMDFTADEIDSDLLIESRLLTPPFHGGCRTLIINE